jgi:hypothetical protein
MAQAARVATRKEEVGAVMGCFYEKMDRSSLRHFQAKRRVRH